MLAFALFMLSSLGSTSAAPEPWELEWIHVKQDKAVAEDILKKAVRAHAMRRNDAINDPNPIPAKYNKPLDLSKERLVPVCRAYFDKIVYHPADKSRYQFQWSACTCTFVRDNLVVLAAHCFNADPKITTATKDWAVSVVQQYGIDGNEVTTKEVTNLALEWWYPTRFPNQPPKTWNIDEDAADFAFIKTERKFVGAHLYELMVPETAEYTIIGKNVMAVGYPKDARNNEVAVAIRGVAEMPTKPLVSIEGTPPAILNPLLIGLVGKTHRGKQLLFFKKETEKEDMFGGGSGGPWILRESGVKQMGALGDKLRWGLFAVTSWGPLDISDPVYMRGSAGPRVTEGLIKVVDRINVYETSAMGATPTKGGPVERVEKIDDQNEKVKFKGL